MNAARRLFTYMTSGPCLVEGCRLMILKTLTSTTKLLTNQFCQMSGLKLGISSKPQLQQPGKAKQATVT
ncbi:hypothetical protein T11_16455 [Trichinella zimbabwensis]|uniref:Uncharacterized protein n=1 Tax=Trichinella zimbabwensis TaxID=268475 RepID=A0A0V1I708_9BILA|nr:hypothetical protein T11_16455 [Trichinella zimbabwensis]